jgi:hypothetical protein
MSGYLDSIASIMRESTPLPGRESSDSSLKLNVMLLAESARRRQRIRRKAGVASVAFVLGIGAVTAVGSTRIFTGERAIEYRVAGNPKVAPIGQYVAPATKEPLALKFSEGSVVQLDPGARARVAKTTTHGATVLLETGGAKVNVVHRPAADWTILAGPYTVHVTGTAFQLNYESSSQRFELAMKSGVVNVEGPGLTRPVEVKADERFVHYVGDPKFEHGNASQGNNPSGDLAATSPDPSANAAAMDPVQSDSVHGANRSFVGVEASKNASAASRSGWAADVARGEYSAVYRRANEKGWTQVLAEANQSDLMAVANAARFLGRTVSSREALEALRHRFKGSYSALSATYLLGRLAEPTSPKEAMGWYLQYEREAPNGALVAEAAGRRLLLIQASGDRPGAERLARDYVSRYPDGPYAGVARKIALP